MTESAPPQRVPRWLWLVLAVSLALNAAGAGLLGGLALRDRGRVAEDGLTLRHVMRDSPDTLRRKARAVFDEQRGAFEALRRDTAAAQSRVAEVAGGEPFDPAALEAALAELRAAQGALTALRHRALAQVIEVAPPEARSALARRLSSARDRGHGRREAPERDGRDH